MQICFITMLPHILEINWHAKFEYDNLNLLVETNVCRYYKVKRNDDMWPHYTEDESSKCWQKYGSCMWYN